MNIVMSFVIKGKKVLVIDGDLWYGMVLVYVGLFKKGLSDYLGNKEVVWNELFVIDKKYFNLYIILVGIIFFNLMELLEDGSLVILM